MPLIHSWKKTAIVLAISTITALALTACGGGSSSDSGSSSGTTPVASTTPTTITVMDGLIQNAVVCVDSNNDGVCDSTELQGKTSDTGKVTLDIPTSKLATAKLVAMVNLNSTDVDNGAVTTAYTLTAPAGKLSVLSPLTNLVQTKIEVDYAKGLVTSVDAAEAFVKGQIGLGGTSLSLFDNFVAQRATSPNHQKLNEVARLLVTSTQASTVGATFVSASSCTAASAAAGYKPKENIQAGLLNNLNTIRSSVDTIVAGCTGQNSLLQCDAAFKNKALLISPCSTDIPPSAQTITFITPPHQTLGTATPTLSTFATASSGYPVTFSSTTTSVCTVSGYTLTLVGSGVCTIAANQAGSVTVLPAPQVSGSFTVTAAAGVTYQQITFVQPANQVVGLLPTLVASSSSGLPVTFSSSTPSICTVKGTTAYFVGVGICNITASQLGDSTYASAVPISKTFAVDTPFAMIAQAITFPQPPAKMLGEADTTLVATSTSGLPVVFSTDTPQVCTINGNQLHPVTAGTCMVTANVPVSTYYLAAPTVSRTLTISNAVIVTSAPDGKVVYNTVYNGMSCVSCHTITPALNVSNVLKGADAPAVILGAINNNVGGMGVLGGMHLTTQQLHDLAAYLKVPTL